MEFRFSKAFWYFFVGCMLLAVFRLGYVIFVMDPIKLRSGLIFDRGDILDRNGKILATSIPTYNIYVNNKTLPPLPKKRITKITGVDPSWTNQLITNKVFLLKRYLAKDKAQQLRKLRQDSLLFEKVYQRVHPFQNHFSHALGMVDHHSLGISGIEKSMHAYLSPENPPRQDVITTIDIELQKAVEKQLKKTIREFRASKGMVLVQDIASGEIRVMASIPTFDYDKAAKELKDNVLNPNITAILEPGSLLKVFFIAYLIEHNHYNLDQTFNCQGELRLIDGEVINCTGVHGEVNFAKIIQYSCNSGIIQATDILKRKEIHDFLYHCQFGRQTGIKIPLESKGIIRKPKDWGIRTTATIPIGHGFAAPPIQIISSFSALLSDGVYVPPRIIDKIITKGLVHITNDWPTKPVKRLFSSKTSKLITFLLGYGTTTNSTGSLARYGEYIPIGKTGTSQLVNFDRGGYLTNSYNAMFIGAYPPEKPLFTALVILNDPKLSHYGGKVAAPLFSELLPDLFSAYGLKQAVPQWVDNPSLKSKSDYLNFKNHQMPDFRKKSLRDVLIGIHKMRLIFQTKDLSFDVKIKGHGLVVKQHPAPGEFVKNKSEIVIYLKPK